MKYLLLFIFGFVMFAVISGAGAGTVLGNLSLIPFAILMTWCIMVMTTHQG